ncbi:hypothetical protein BpHYR1_033470 [Brachionus plicatilis]|uniref:Uncharacterized protein n=1 Tax=Brachionus plicatilis TaxID=10195 RepID=A0A3M7STR3_BRAPC|nr:hypothetical protein BpHYR1_033470 [Brachionus plicatilis]
MKITIRVMQNFHTISRYGFRAHFWILPFLSQNFIKRFYSIDTFSDRELNALYSELRKNKFFPKHLTCYVNREIKNYFKINHFNILNDRFDLKI